MTASKNASDAAATPAASTDASGSSAGDGAGAPGDATPPVPDASPGDDAAPDLSAEAEMLAADAATVAIDLGVTAPPSDGRVTPTAVLMTGDDGPAARGWCVITSQTDAVAMVGDGKGQLATPAQVEMCEPRYILRLLDAD